jgi:hypothetical protein
MLVHRCQDLLYYEEQVSIPLGSSELGDKANGEQSTRQDLGFHDERGEAELSCYDEG